MFAGLYRAEVYDPESLDKGCAELLIRKNRGGKLGVVPLAFSANTSASSCWRADCRPGAHRQ
ncbi:MAG: hypothetical protein IPI57_14495 [Candidatus Competibacteraceae bacterium]|nr:hypothetical protein [Candidatus Competibacteraceae bacterium]